MIGDLGAPELLIIFAIVVLLFGAGKVSRLGKDLGTAVREFRSAVSDDKDDQPIALLSPGASEGASGQAIASAAAPTANPNEARPPALF